MTKYRELEEEEGKMLPSSPVLDVEQKGSRCERDVEPVTEGDEEEQRRCCSNCAMCMLCRTGCYNVYIMHILLFCYLVNQMDRYMLAVCTIPMSQDIGYGDMACMVNSTYSEKQTADVNCNATSPGSCSLISNNHGQQVCEWNYNGQGFEYQLLAGPIFIVVYTFSGIFLGLAADYYNRKNLLAMCVIFWSVMTILTGAVQEYWQLAILRFGLGFGQAAMCCAVSMLDDLSEPHMKSLVLGLYSWGIYMGFGLSFAVGNGITQLNILNQGWRWAFYISGMPGIILGTLLLFTIKEPERKVRRGKGDTSDPRILLANVTWWGKLMIIIKNFMSPSLLMICFAGSIRNAAGYIWAYNTQIYYMSLGASPTEISTYLSWIPMLGGSTSVVIGGIIADRVVISRGSNARLVVIAISLIGAAPFAAGALLLDPPGAYWMLVPCYIIGEMWVGVTMAVVVELVPTALRTSSVALYLFIISNIGGNAPLIVPSLQAGFRALGMNSVESLRDTLLVLFPGFYVLSGFLYLLTIIVIKYARTPQLMPYQPISDAHGAEGQPSSSSQDSDETTPILSQDSEKEHDQ